MIPIQELLNKIKWNQKGHPKDYVLYYYDQVEEKPSRLEERNAKLILFGKLLAQ